MVRKCGGEEAFKESLAKGEIKVVEDDDGVEYFSTKTLKSGRTQETAKSQTTGKTKAVEEATRKKIAAVLDSIEWEFAYTQKDVQDQKPKSKIPT